MGEMTVSPGSASVGRRHCEMFLTLFHCRHNLLPPIRVDRRGACLCRDALNRPVCPRHGQPARRSGTTSPDPAAGTSSTSLATWPHHRARAARFWVV